jgi:hypothetical protein
MKSSLVALFQGEPFGEYSRGEEYPVDGELVWDRDGGELVTGVLRPEIEYVDDMLW